MSFEDFAPRATKERQHWTPQPGNPEGLDQLFHTVDLLADEPRPEGTTGYRTPDRRRLRSGRYRVLYDVNDNTVTVVVIHAGRTS
ncbi:hypothetical protein GCM10009554_46250 [Kribbella koreensis]|uniref:mRNA interferase RelE/StbE n=1 Tax=Kribbella koreensis TaxID=57909 RepID=A0ABN1QWN9_9ACTN